MEDQEKSLPALDWLPEALRVANRDAPQETVEMKAGDTCPRCQKGVLDFDGLLNLACPQCGYSLGGCFT
jgi:uncharacterized protein (DUF983 family)